MFCHTRMLATVAAAATTMAMLPALGAPAGAARMNARRSAQVGLPASPTRPGRGAVLLVNGATVQLARAGAGHGPGLVSTVGGGLAGALLHLSLSGRSYEIPAAALPYLDRGLDPSLFDLRLLAGREAAGRLPVQVAYRGSPPSLPGVTITSSAAGVADGYLTAASARRFGAALVRQFVADHRRGSYGQDGLFGRGVTLAVAGVPAVRAPSHGRSRPAGFALHTLTVTGKNIAGKADTGDVVVVFNVDNTALFGDFNENLNIFFRGTAKFSVPAGHYWAFSDFIDVSAKGQPTAERLVVLPQFTVSGDTSVKLDEPAADSRVNLSTARKSSALGTLFDLRRVPRAGTVVSFSPIENGAFPLWVSPTTRRPTVGSLEDYTQQWRASPAGTARPYEYDLAYRATGVIPGQQRTVDQHSLATIRARYYSDANSAGDVVNLGLFRDQLTDQLFSPDNAYQVGMPRVQTQYVTGNPAISWYEGMAQYDDVKFGMGGPSGGQWSGPRSYRAGQTVNENWDAYPLHPAAATSGGLTVGLHPEITPGASRAGDTLRLDVEPFSDSNGHEGEGFFNDDGTGTGSFQIDENGKKIAGGRSVKTFWQLKLPSKPSLISFTVNAARRGPRYPLSNRTQTTWTWRSAHQAGGTLPAGWECAPFSGSRQCAVQPMMTLSYHVVRLGLNESAPPGRQVLDVTAGHLQFARAARVTSTAVQVSVDGGKTWRTAAVRSLGRGHYRATYNAAAGQSMTLRVSASDAASGRITETITRAYRVAAAPMRAACPSAPAHHMRCLVEVRTRTAPGSPPAASPALTTAGPSGWGAKTIEGAYKLPVRRGSGQTVAIVDAFRTPDLASYLATYRKQYGLPPCRPGSCLRMVNQAGRTAPLPRSAVGTGWDLETTLDADMVSAACPRCKIMVVEARSDADSALAAAENTAARLGAKVISNSYGSREDGFAMTLAKDYDHPGHTTVVSSGDTGFTAADFPANLATVTAVGGTELARAGNLRGWRETVWNQDGDASGSGCSAYVAKPSWQGGSRCGMRTTADVSALASNVAIYEKQYGGWVNVGGTSAAAPLVAGVYALAGNAGVIRPGYEYRHRGSLFDVRTGNNNRVGTGGAVCGHTYLCVARKGYDAPTGLGTPDGTGAF